MASRCLQPDDYSVGWISALSLELKAAMRMLDEEHKSPFPDWSDTPFVYGRIGRYNVVLAWLPAGEYGIGSAASVATALRSRFHRLSFCLLVGIGGGVPATHDIRLGDVVVSLPRDGSSGVVQYDLGRSTADGFKRVGYLNAPPRSLRNLLTLYRARGRISYGSSHEFSPGFKFDPSTDRPEKDYLFEADYEHRRGSNCEECDSCHLIQRSSREALIHYGTIASGNQVIKNAKDRDKLIEQLGKDILCFEMEAAGVMNELGCVVIRGICDYADSHKNKEWQPYAADIAAAYAKDLLLTSAVDDEEQTSVPCRAQKIRALAPISSRPRFRSQRSSVFANAGVAQDLRLPEVDDYFLVHGISSYEADRVLWQHTHGRCPETAEWIFQNCTFKLWRKSESHRCIWLSGKIGAGKTMITGAVVQRLQQDLAEQAGIHLVIHYFFDQSYRQGLTALALVDSMIQQIINFLGHDICFEFGSIKETVRRLYNQQGSPPSAEEALDRVILPLFTLLDSVILVLDGLDECEAEESLSIHRIVGILLDQRLVRVFLAGRESFTIRLPGLLELPISEECSKRDICKHVRWKLEKMTLQRVITTNQTLLKEIESSLVARADRMILWVNLQIEYIWSDCWNDEEIRHALANLPKDLNETYFRCVLKIEGSHIPKASTYAGLILAWTLTAKRPLSLIEVREALAVDAETGILDRNHMPTNATVLASCANLVTLEDTLIDQSEEDSRYVLLVHHSLRQYLNTTKHPSILLDQIRAYTDSEALTLGNLCMQHLLSRNYSLALERTSPKMIVQVPIPRPDLGGGTFGSLMSSLLPRSSPTTFKFPSMARQAANVMALPAFFYYSRDQWPILTSGIEPRHLSFDTFKSLALQPNLTYRIHPWQPLGQSMTSHLAGLLLWSIKNTHPAMLDALISDATVHTLAEILRVPVDPNEGYNSVIVIVRCDAVWALAKLRALQDRRITVLIRDLLRAQDANGWNSLHHAADAGVHEILKELFKVHQVSFKLSSQRDGSNSPLTIAVRKGHTLVVRLLSSAYSPPASVILDDYKGRNYAIRDGLIGMLKDIDSSPSHVRPISGTRFQNDAAAALFAAIESGHLATVEYLLDVCDMGRVDILVDPFYGGLTVILTSARQFPGLLDIFLKSGRIELIDPIFDAAIRAKDYKATDVIMQSLRYRPRLKESMNDYIRQTLYRGEFAMTRYLASSELGHVAGKIGEIDFERSYSYWTVDTSMITEDICNIAHYAARCASTKIFNLILKHCTSINIRDEEGCTLLMRAASWGRSDNLQVLLHSSQGKQIELDALDPEGHSALSYCLARKLKRENKKHDNNRLDTLPTDHRGCARILLSFGASESQLDKETRAIVREIKAGSRWRRPDA